MAELDQTGPDQADKEDHVIGSRVVAEQPVAAVGSAGLSTTIPITAAHTTSLSCWLVPTKSNWYSRPDLTLQ